MSDAPKRKPGRPRKTTPSPKRTGTAFWFPDTEGNLLRQIAAAEERTLQTVLSRALRFYADHSEEYGRWRARQDDPV
jgi:hypothetical protein